MALFDDDRPVKRPVTHEVGQDLSQLSVAELEDRLALLRDEIERVEREIAGKEKSRSAADAFFKS
ncbi:MAG: DUF1192 domain-containing protein [Hyphomicrobiales bacterium]|nr:MAG: DUF1192 domain-containing protein [Hyphomicrobiales bacterium]